MVEFIEKLTKFAEHQKVKNAFFIGGLGLLALSIVRISKLEEKVKKLEEED